MASDKKHRRVPGQKRKPLAQTTDPSRPSEHGSADVPRYPVAAAPRGYTTSSPDAPRMIGGAVHLREQLPHGGGMMPNRSPEAPTILGKPRGV